MIPMTEIKSLEKDFLDVYAQLVKLEKPGIGAVIDPKDFSMWVLRLGEVLDVAKNIEKHADKLAF